MKKDCPCFKDNPVKIRGERLGNLSQEDDKMMGSKTQNLLQSSRLQVSSFDSLQLGGEWVGGWGGLLAFTANRFQLGNGWITKGVGSARDSRVAARASPKGQGAWWCPARERQLLQSRFQERAVSPNPPPPPSCFKCRPQGTVDYRSSSLICLYSDDGDK